MLITKQQVEHAMSLDTAAVVEALRRTSKITDGEITAVEFRGMNLAGHYIYKVFGPGEDSDQQELGTVYLKHFREPMSMKVVLVSEY